MVYRAACGDYGYLHCLPAGSIVASRHDVKIINSNAPIDLEIKLYPDELRRKPKARKQKDF
jgi:hypothetical protein